MPDVILHKRRRTLAPKGQLRLGKAHKSATWPVLWKTSSYQQPQPSTATEQLAALQPWTRGLATCPQTTIFLWHTLTIRTLKANLCGRLPHLNSLPNSPIPLSVPIPRLFPSVSVCIEKLKDAKYRPVELFSFSKGYNEEIAPEEHEQMENFYALTILLRERSLKPPEDCDSRMRV